MLELGLLFQNARFCQGTPLAPGRVLLGHKNGIVRQNPTSQSCLWELGVHEIFLSCTVENHLHYDVYSSEVVSKPQSEPLSLGCRTGQRAA